MPVPERKGLAALVGVLSCISPGSGLMPKVLSQALLADVSHELRSPLTRLSVSLELMRRGETDVVKQMQMDLDRMNVMIGEVLLLTRLELQPSQIASAQVGPAVMLGQIAQDAEFERKDEGKRVTVTVRGSCSIRCDHHLAKWQNRNPQPATLCRR